MTASLDFTNFIGPSDLSHVSQMSQFEVVVTLKNKFPQFYRCFFHNVGLLGNQCIMWCCNYTVWPLGAWKPALIGSDIPIQGLQPSEAAFKGQFCHNATRRLSQFEGSSKCSFFSLFLDDAPLLSFVASHIPRIFVCTKNKKERKKERKKENSDIAGVDGRHKSWHKGGNIRWSNQEILRRLRKVGTVNKVSLKDSPSKATKAGSFEGCRPWIGIQP